MGLTLRTPRLADEALAEILRGEFEADGFGAALKPLDGQTWADWVASLPFWSRGENLPEGLVAFDCFIAEVEGEPVGYVSFRHNLNTETLRSWGGHIGYVVRPNCRQRGYATLMLEQTLAVAKSQGLSQVLVTCDENNMASARVIEKCHGVYESTYEHDDKRTRRYWIAL